MASAGKTGAGKKAVPRRRKGAQPAARKAGGKTARKAARGAGKKGAAQAGGKTGRRPAGPNGKPKKRSMPAPDIEIDGEVLEFIEALDRYKKEHNRPFPSWSEVLHVLRGMGYRRELL